MDGNEVMFFDVEKIVKQKMPNRKLPKFVLNYLKKILHEDELNRFFIDVHGKKGIDFMDAAIHDLLNVTTNFESVENLPSKSGSCIFVSNHPLGGLDSIILGLMLGKRYDGKIKFFANELLMYLTPLNEMFLPVNNLTSVQSRKNARIAEDFFQSDNHLITFPAGTCSRKINGKIQDMPWKKSFVSKAVKYQRYVVPIYFEGRNSNFFYNLSNIRTRLGLPNIEMLYLVNEMFKQRNNHFRVVVGKGIPYETFDKSKSTAEWTTWVREKVYELA